MVKRSAPTRMAHRAGSAPAERPWSRRVTVLAQDPSVTRHGAPVFAKIEIPAEVLRAGPRGYRVHVIDYDATHDVLYPPFDPADGPNADLTRDPFESQRPGILDDPRFHAFNAYALAMRTLARFELALGRRVAWGCRSHVLKIAPHAFADANAFFSPEREALLFGYFRGRTGRTVYTGLSHDVVVHETTHALLAGLREHYLRPSSPDQVAFHEGFADVVAMLSVFSLPEIVGLLLDRESESRKTPRGMVRRDAVERESLVRSALFGLAEQMGREMAEARGDALRRSVRLEPREVALDPESFLEPHRRGEVLVAAVLNAFADVWSVRLDAFRKMKGGFLDRERVAEEGAKAASHLLTMAIRALDYLPPVHVSFSDFLTALLTSDAEMQPDDSRFDYRSTLLKRFASFGIRPVTPSGRWGSPLGEARLDRSHFESLTRDPIEVFRFVWENPELLRLQPQAHTEVLSVRPCARTAPDGFILKETVAEYVQFLKVRASELGRGPLAAIEAPEGLDPKTDILLEGGTTLLFDEYGRLKFAIGTGVASAGQTARLQYLYDIGQIDAARPRPSFSALHRARSLHAPLHRKEVW